MKHYYPIGLLFLAAWFVSIKVAIAQDSMKASGSLKSEAIAADSSSPTRLFDREDVLTFTLTANLRVLLKDRGEKPLTHPARLTYTDSQQSPVNLPLTLKVRGNFRRNGANCVFPPLLIDFPKKKTKNTLFAHQNKLKLVTHCKVDEWVVREYLVYKLYNLLTDLSFRARLARVTYVDSLGKRAPETHWGFLLEDETDIAKRNGVSLSNIKQTNMAYADSLTMATVVVFEYMIGNSDWSVPYLHNIRLFDNGKAGSLPVPYDFDYSGIIETNYAIPPEQLDIQSVRQRMYRGLVYSDHIFQQVFDKFYQVKPQLYALYETDSRLDKSYVKRTLRYLDEFYALISKPASARVRFSQDARSGVVIKGMK